MATWYVSTSGNNANSGTSTGAAWRTIQYAVTNSSVNAGDTIKVLPGTYDENIQILATNGGRQGSSGSPITLTSNDHGNMAVITGTAARNQMQIYNRSYWTIDHMAFKDFKTGGIFVLANTQDCVGITVQNCLFEKQRASQGSMFHTIVFDGDEPYSTNYSYVLNNTIRDVETGYPGEYNETITMHHNCHHCLIEGNQIWGTTFIGINAVANDWQWGTGKPNHIIFRNNRVDDVERAPSGAQTGLYVDGGDDILIENNYITKANGLSLSVESWTAKGKFVEFSRHIVRNNVFDGLGGNCIIMYVQGGDRYTVYSAPFQRWVNDSAVVHNVMLINHAVGGAYKWGFCRRARVKNNVMANYGTPEVRNNIQYNALITFIMEHLSADGWVSDGNLYWRPDNPRFSWPGVSEQTSLAGLRSVSGQDYNSIYGEPVFAQSSRSALEHYKLASTSPGYGAGVALTTATNSGSSSTTLKVGDARYFCDGYGLIAGDTIYVGGTEAQCKSVDYSTNTITLESAISWSSGAEVGYASNPSIGILDDVAGEWVQTITANAGPDQTVYDNTGDGIVTVGVTAELSYSPVEITSYEWTYNNKVISTTETTLVNLALGTHVITLTIEDSDGDTATDTVTIYVLDPGDIVNNTVVRNPCLNGFDSWLNHSTGVTTWESAPSGTGIEVTVTSDGGNTQLSQSGLVITTGQVLKMRIVGEAIGTTQSFEVSLFKNTSPWTNYGLYETVTFATTETVVEREFVVTADANDGRLMAWFTTGDNVIIREFNLLDPDAEGCYNEDAPDIVTSPGSVSLTSTDDYFVDHGGQYSADANPSYAGDLRSDFGNYDQRTGWIFTLGASEDIPLGAEITAATLKVTASGYDTGGSLPAMRIYVENAANPSKPTNHTDATSRTLIAASGAWEPVAWTSLTQYTSNDFADAIQTLVNNQGGLDTGARIHIVLSDKDSGYQSKRLAYINPAAAELDISWDAPAGGAGSDSFAEEINPMRPGIRTGVRQGF